MNRLRQLILIFAILFAAFLILPAFLNAKFPPYPLMDVADVFDILTPLVLLPLYGVLLYLGGSERPSLSEKFFFVLFAAFWAQGQGMHLAANSIGHLVESSPQTDAAQLTHFYDEVLGHYLWQIGIIGLAGLLFVRQWRNPFKNEPAAFTLEFAAAVIYGVTTFIVAIEAGTVPVTLPFAIILGIFAIVRGRQFFQAEPLVAFFGSAYLLAAVLIIGWGIYFRGFPQFSELGIIK